MLSVKSNAAGAHAHFISIGNIVQRAALLASYAFSSREETEWSIDLAAEVSAKLVLLQILHPGSYL